MAKALELLGVEGDQRAEEFALVAVHHRLRDELVDLEQALDLLGGHVLAARGDDDVLLAVGDAQGAGARVDLADVSGVEPAVDDRLGRGLGVAPVLAHDAGALDQDFAVFGDLDLGAGEGGTDGADVIVVGQVDGGAGRALGHAEALDDGETRVAEEPVDLLRQGSAAREHDAHATAQALAEAFGDLGEDQLLEELST